MFRVCDQDWNMRLNSIEFNTAEEAITYATEEYSGSGLVCLIVNTSDGNRFSQDCVAVVIDEDVYWRIEDNRYELLDGDA